MLNSPIAKIRRPYGPDSSLRNDGNEGGKKAIDVDKQNNTFARASRFFVYLPAVVARLQRETA